MPVVPGGADLTRSGKTALIVSFFNHEEHDEKATGHTRISNCYIDATFRNIPRTYQKE
jgi:hypothetical protein